MTGDGLRPSSWRTDPTIDDTDRERLDQLIDRLESPWRRLRSDWPDYPPDRPEPRRRVDEWLDDDEPRESAQEQLYNAWTEDDG